MAVTLYDQGVPAHILHEQFVQEDAEIIAFSSWTAEMHAAQYERQLNIAHFAGSQE